MKRALGQNGRPPQNVQVKIYLLGEGKDRGKTAIYADGREVPIEEYIAFLTQGGMTGFVNFHGAMYTASEDSFEGGLSTRKIHGGVASSRTVIEYCVLHFTKTS